MKGNPLRVGSFVGGLILLLLSLLGGYSNFTHYKSQLLTKRKTILAKGGNTYLLKSSLDAQVKALKKLTSSIANSFWLRISLRNFSYGEIGKALRPYLLSFKEIKGLSVTNPSGDIVWENGISSHYASLIPAGIDTLKGALFMGKWGTGEKQFAEFSEGIFSGNRLVGTLTVVFELNSLLRNLKKYGLPWESGGIYLIDRENHAIYKEVRDTLFDISRIVESGEGHFKSSILGQSYSVTILKLKEAPWRLVTFTPLTPISTNYFKFLYSRNGIFFLLLVLVSLILVILSLSISSRGEIETNERLKKMREYVKYISRHPFERPLSPPPMKELEPLFTAFNGLLQEVEEKRLLLEKEGRGGFLELSLNSLEEFEDALPKWLQERTSAKSSLINYKGQEGESLLLSYGIRDDTLRELRGYDIYTLMKKDTLLSYSIEDVPNLEIKQALEKEGMNFLVSYGITSSLGILLFYKDPPPKEDVIKKKIEALKSYLVILEEIWMLKGETGLLKRRLRENEIIVSSLTERLGAMERSEKELLASVSHELRTPLNAIIGFSELLLNGEYGELPMEQRRAIENIYQSGQHLLNLINDILELSKIERGEIKPRKEALIVPDVLRRLLDMAKSLAGKKRLEFVLEVEPSLRKIVTDPTLFKQIIFNLLSNAVKFSPDKGKIRVKSQKIGEQLFVTVTDTGRGIKKEDLDRIFDPFFQIEEGLPKLGLGLGLTLVKRYAEILGGTVWAESEGPGKGSSFTVSLPFEEVIEEGKLPREKLAEEKGMGPLALVIEDDVPAAELLAKILTGEGYRVLWAADGEEGLRWVKEHSPDIVFLDLLLPKIDGWTFLESLRDERVAVPVIVVSILDRDKSVFDLGARDFIVKPITKEKIVDALHLLTEQEDDPFGEEVLVVEGKESRKLVKILEKMGYHVRIIPGEEVSRLKDSDAVVASFRDLGLFLKAEGNNG